MECNKVQMKSSGRSTRFIIDGIELKHARSFNMKRAAGATRTTLEIVIDCDLETKEQPIASIDRLNY